MKTDFQVVIDLIERFLPGCSDQFLLESIEAENGLDTYELDCAADRPVLRGSGVGALAAAFGWYLKYTLGANLSWCGRYIPPLPGGKAPLPKPYRRVIAQRYRVYMNYCTHSYSAAWWGWDRWEYEIDMMALSGVNMPLAITGTEAVWYRTLLDLGFSDEEARAYLVGPGFFAWQWMTNIEGHGGPLPKSWIDQHEILGRKILERELSFGMYPIQQGYTGCVPNQMAEKYPEGKYLIKKPWNAIGHTTELDPVDPLFRKIGLIFLENQRKIFGAYGFYACDPFHEGTPPVDGSEYLALVGQSVSSLYAAFDPNYTWVMQAWSIRKDIVTAVSPDHLLILDLDCTDPVGHNGYWGYRYVVGTLHNFGARMSSLHGDLRRMAANRFLRAKECAPAACGTGLFMEGIGQNPVFYDLGLEMLTRSDRVDPTEWVSAYADRRYGVRDAHAHEAWKILLDHVYTPNTDFTERGTVLCTRPCLKLRGTGPSDSFGIHYENKWLWEAIRLLRQVPSETEGYHCDLLDLCRQLLSNYAQTLYAKVANAFAVRDLPAFQKTSGAFLTLIREMDRMLAVWEPWTLQKWIADARAQGTTDAERDLYEQNARMQVTFWGNEEGSVLFDYAWKEWSGLLDSYYRVRWEKFFAMLEEKLQRNEPYDEDALPVFENRIIWHASDFYTKLADWEVSWTKDTTPIPLAEGSWAYVFALLDRYAAELDAESCGAAK